MAKKPNNLNDFATFVDTSIESNEQLDRDIGAELFGNAAYQNKVIDNFEKAHGISAAKTDKKQFEYKPRLFDMAARSDAEKFALLLNSKKHFIQFMDHNWTVDGRYLIFVIYAELIDDNKKSEADEESE